jgi:hypothetical protein
MNSSHALLFCSKILILLGFVLGCDEPRRVTDQVIKAKKETDAKLDAIKLYAEMDLNMQQVFFLFRDLYLDEWPKGPVQDMQQLMLAASAKGKDGILLRDASKLGIQPIWKLERPVEPELASSTLIAHAPHLFPNLYWGLMADGQFVKLTQAQLDEKLGSMPGGN